VREGTTVTISFPPERVIDALSQIDEGLEEKTQVGGESRRGRRWRRRAAA